MQGHNYSTASVQVAKRRKLYSLPNRLFNIGLKRPNRTLVSHLLHSNLPPSESERATVCNVVAIIQKDIEQLQRKPMLLQQKRRRRLSQLLRVHNAVLSPIRWVPTEVLEQIFRHCTSPSRNCHWRELPWAISQVCRTWRNITLNLPCLWNRVPIHLRDDTLGNLKALAAFLRSLLERSHDAPLYLYIYAPFKEYDWHPLINTVALHSERVEELAIESSMTTIHAFQKIKTRLPLLRKLTLTKVSRPRPAGTLILDIFEDAPLLREAAFVRFYTHELILPWHQLITFSAHSIDRTGLSQVVAHSLDIERLEITGHSYGAGPKIATLRRLTSLKVRLKNPAISSNFFFGSLNLPVVEEIEVEEYQGELLPHLTSMLSRCPTTSLLRKLTFRTTMQEAGDLTSLLKFTPRLVELDLDLPPLDDLLELIAHQESRPLVPLLETLTIHATNEGKWRKDIPLTTLARSRCEIDEILSESFLPGERRRLRSFRIVFPNSSSCHRAQAELNEWLEHLKPTSDQTCHLRLWRDMLHHELPELDHKPPPLKRTFDLKFTHRLDRLLGAIEDFQLNDVKALYASRLYSSLHRLSCLQPNHIPGDTIYHFRMRSYKILKTWGASLRKDTSILQWAMKGTKTLIYIPMNQVLCESPEALNMVYGLDEHPQFEDTFHLL